MPTHNYTTTNPAASEALAGTLTLGKRSPDTKLGFPNSPVGSGDLEDTGSPDPASNPLRKHFVDLVLDGDVSNGFCFSSFSRDFTGGPGSDLSSDQVPPANNVEWKNPGDPANSFVPNVTVNGTNPLQLPEPAMDEAAFGHNGNLGSITAPADTSAAIAAATLGSYGLGKSAGS
jgi:hypothetical protein